MHVNRLFLLAILFASLARLWAGPLDNWHSRTNFGFSALSDIAYHDGVYVLVNITPGVIITATNLVTPGEFAVQEVASGRPRAVEYGAGRFVVASEGGPILSSTNGYDWVDHGATGQYWSMVYANGRFVAVGSRSVATSTNGTDWVTSQDVPVFVSDVMFGNGVFLATGSTTNAVSSDGIEWEMYTLPSKVNFYTVGFGEGKFVGITTASSGDNLLISTDGRNWTAHGRLELVRPARIAWGNGYFVTAGGGGRAYSDDGISWTVVPTDRTGHHVEFVNGRFVALGNQSLAESDPVTQLVFRSGGEIEIRSVAGQRVRLEATDTVTQGWEPVGSETIVSGGEVKLTLPTEGPQRFFRAVLVD